MKYFSFAKSSVIVFFILGVLVLVSTSVVAYLNFRDQVESHDYISESESRINMFEKIQSLLSDIETSRKAYQMSNDRQYVNAINFSQLQIDSLLKKLRISLSGSPKALQKMDTLSLAIGESFELVKRSVELQDKNVTNSRLLKPIADKSKIINSDLQFRILRMKADEEAAIQNKQNLENQSYRFTFYTIAGATVVSSIIFILVFIILHKKGKGGAPEDEEITREELESIVRERTAEISQINNKLNSKLTELEQKDKDLMRSEAYYKMLFNQAHDAILIIDPNDEKVLDANSRTCEIYSFNREELIGLSLKAISKNPVQGEENLKKILEKGEYSFQTVHYNKKLNEMLIEINASVIDYNGRKAILSINRDITERVLVIH